MNLRIGHRAESLVVLLRHDADAAVPRGAAEGNAQPRHGPSSVPCLFLLYCPIAYSLRLRKHCRKVLWAFPCSTTGSNCTALHCAALHCAALHCAALHCAALRCTALHCTALGRLAQPHGQSTGGDALRRSMAGDCLPAGLSGIHTERLSGAAVSASWHAPNLSSVQ